MATATVRMGDRETWPERPWLLLGLGTVAALTGHALLRGIPGTGRVALMTFVVIGAMVAGFTLERTRRLWAVGFAVVSGAVIASVTYWQSMPEASGSDGIWRLACAGLAVAIAAPLFQTMRDAGAWRLFYPVVHGHAWTNVVIWFAGWVFVGLAFALAWLLAALFDLIGIDALRHALEERVVWLPLIGAALGGAVGLLRERDRIVGALQRVVLAVLSVLAPVLAVGLLLFLASLPFTGLAPLWEATRSTTPILLTCVIAALILVNSVVGDGSEPDVSPVLRAGAIGLGMTILPLALIALASVGSRIGQHGLTPDRLWALTFVAVAIAYGLAYVTAVAGPRPEWSARVRAANLRLAFGLGVLALSLATPLIGFGAISARDQQARLLSGEVAPDVFDWAAMAYDFGPAGRRALEQLAAASPSDAVRHAARTALAAVDRAQLSDRRQARSLAGAVTVVPSEVTPPAELFEAFAWQQCGDDVRCVLHYTPDAAVAVLVSGCDTCQLGVRLARRTATGWEPTESVPIADHRAAVTGKDLAAGPIEVRSVERRQLFVAGQPVGGAFE